MEDKGFRKMVTEWIFQQSIGVIIALLAIGLLEYQNYQLNQRVQFMENRVEAMLTWEREILKEALDKNTRALEDFKMVITAKQSR